MWQDEEKDSVDINTKTPTTTPKKVKDPKKVEAGRRLADYNKKAKEAQKKVIQQQESQEESYCPELSLGTISVVLGIGLTALNIFLGLKTIKIRSTTGRKRYRK